MRGGRIGGGAGGDSTWLSDKTFIFNEDGDLEVTASQKKTTGQQRRSA